MSGVDSRAPGGRQGQGQSIDTGIPVGGDTLGSVGGVPGVGEDAVCVGGLGGG